MENTVLSYHAQLNLFNDQRLSQYMERRHVNNRRFNLFPYSSHQLAGTLQVLRELYSRPPGQKEEGLLGCLIFQVRTSDKEDLNPGYF